MGGEAFLENKQFWPFLPKASVELSYQKQDIFCKVYKVLKCSFQDGKGKQNRIKT